tara:strand:- start:417 stop:638 length:222 start_codon:yes stop_codon:yes gene_type:complete
MVKEFLLITMLTDPMVYTEKSACEEAAKKLAQVDETAICIPAGKPQDTTMDTFIDLVIKLQAIQPKEVDSVNK